MLTNKRINQICDFIDKTGRIIDIGSDHAYLAIECVLRKIAGYAVVSDINLGPVNKAIGNIKKHGLKDDIQAVVCDGLDQIELMQGDTIVIAGMGGELIANIIMRAKDRIDRSMSFILQPASSVYELKRYLFENGFYISKEKYFLYREKPYIIINTALCTDKSINEISEPVDFYLPKGDVMSTKEALCAYFLQVIKRQEAVLKGYIHTNDARESRQKKLVGELWRYYESI